MIRKILFPVDFSASCAAMAAYVRRAAALWGATVSLLHVCDLNSYSGFELYARPGSEIAEDHWNVAKDKLEQFLLLEFPRESFPRILLAGDTASVIAETAKTNKFDLIAMPTHAGKFRRMLLGSTTAKVLNAAECPVLTTQHAEIVAPRSLEHRTWVCAIESSPDSARVLQLARSAAPEVGANLFVVHAVGAGGDLFTPGPDSEQRESARMGLRDLAATAGYPGEVRIVRGPMKEALLSVLNESQADVLVMGRTGPSSVHGRMGDVVGTLIRDSVCPVISI